jgi:hypothetical protein
MRRVFLCLALAVASVTVSWTQQPSAAPQTARQALLEMFFSKEPGTLVKHLPLATQAALEKSGALASLQQYSLMMNQLQTSGQKLQTFETGSLMLATEDPKTGQKFEVLVENDALNREQDDIEVTFRVYKNGQAQVTPFMPQMTFSMKEESQVWKLNEVSVTIHLPLADPDLLKALTERMAPHPTTTSPIALHPAAPSQSIGSDAMVLAAMKTIVAAEATYASTYANVGYTCSLSSLDGFGGGEPNEHQAMLINSGLASGKKYGFVFTLSECSGVPASGFHLTATPNGNTFGRKAFCADQSGVIRSSDDGNPATCWARGAAIP